MTLNSRNWGVLETDFRHFIDKVIKECIWKSQQKLAKRNFNPKVCQGVKEIYVSISLNAYFWFWARYTVLWLLMTIDKYDLIKKRSNTMFFFKQLFIQLKKSYKLNCVLYTKIKPENGNKNEKAKLCQTGNW